MLWAAIKTDLHDFLTSAATDETIDSSGEGVADGYGDAEGAAGVDDNDESHDNSDVNGGDESSISESPEDEALRLSELEETYAEPLILVVGAVGTGERSDEADVSHDENDRESSEIDVAERRRLRQFLESFNTDKHAVEIAELLGLLPPPASKAPVHATRNDANETSAQTDETAPEVEMDAQLTPLQIHYKNLVPSKIAHEEFWTRYYYRCNPALIAERRQRKSLQNESTPDAERAMKEVSKAALQMGKSAALLIKGGISGALGAFHAGVEGAFVVGALEDDDSYFEGDSVEKENRGEEGGCESGEGNSSGWDSDDSNRDAIDSEEDDSIHDEVAFVENAASPLKLESLDVVKLRRSLIRAEGERNRTMETVDGRNMEIARLKLILETDSKGGAEVDALKNELVRLRTAVGLIGARAAVSELKAKIDAINNSNNSAATLDQLIREECDKQSDLEGKLAERRREIERVRIQKEEVDRRVSDLLATMIGR